MVFIYKIFLLELEEQFELKLFFRRKREVLIRGQILEIYTFNTIKGKMDNIIVPGTQNIP